MQLLSDVRVFSLSRSRDSGGGGVGDGSAAKCSGNGHSGSKCRSADEEEVLSFALQAFETTLVPVFLVGLPELGEDVSICLLSHRPASLPLTPHPSLLPLTPSPSLLHLYPAKLQYSPAVWREGTHSCHLFQLGVDLLSTLADAPARKLAKNLGRDQDAL